MDQLNLFDQLGFYNDGDEVPFWDLGPVVTFDWLCDHIGYQVAVRYRQQSVTYYRVYTVGYLSEGTLIDGCRRIVLTSKGKIAALLDEPGFYIPFCWHLVYEL